MLQGLLPPLGVLRLLFVAVYLAGLTAGVLARGPGASAVSAVAAGVALALVLLPAGLRSSGGQPRASTPRPKRRREAAEPGRRPAPS